MNATNTDAFIIEEFKYRSAYALRMLEDRASTLTLYVTSFIATAAILTFAYEKELGLRALPNLAYLFFLFGIIHTYFFVRLGYLDKKYYDCIEKMNGIRALYSKPASKTSTDIKKILAPRKIPKAFGTFYPLFPATMTFAHIATILYILGILMLSLHLPQPYELNLPIYVLIALLVAGISYLIHYKIAKADKTV